MIDFECVVIHRHVYLFPPRRHFPAECIAIVPFFCLFSQAHCVSVFSITSSAHIHHNRHKQYLVINSLRNNNKINNNNKRKQIAHCRICILSKHENRCSVCASFNSKTFLILPYRMRASFLFVWNAPITRVSLHVPLEQLMREVSQWWSCVWRIQRGEINSSNTDENRPFDAWQSRETH